MPVSQAHREYWFARRFPLEDRRKSMAPIHWKGWAVAAIFVAAMACGGLAFLTLAIAGSMLWGVTVFVIAAVIAATWFIVVAQAKGDHTRTIADYRGTKTGV